MLQDHVPNAATLAFQAGPDHYRPHCQRVRVTKSQVLDPENRVAFSSALTKILSASWQVPLDTHYTELARKVVDAIVKSFPPAKMTAHKLYTSLGTLHKSAEARSLKQQLRFLRKFRSAGIFSCPQNHVR